MTNYRTEWTNEQIEEMHLQRQVWDYAAIYGGLILDSHNDYSIAFPKKHIPIEVNDLMSITRAAYEVGCSRKAVYIGVVKKELQMHPTEHTKVAQVSLSEVEDWYRLKPSFLRQRKKKES